MLGYEIVGQEIVRQGVTHLFGVMGSGNYPIIGYLSRDHGIPYIAARHESGAVAAAAGFARASGRVGVCTVSSGPGAANAVTALTAASRDRAPVVMFLAAISASYPGSAQLIDHRAMCAVTGAGFIDVTDGGKLGSGVARAFFLADVEQRPQVLHCNVDLLAQDHIEETQMTLPEKYRGAQRREGPSADQVSTVIDRLSHSTRPVLLAGRGAVRADAISSLIILADEVGAHLTNTLMAVGAFAGHARDLGVCGGFASDRSYELLKQADCVIAFGASLNHYTTDNYSLFSEADVIQVDEDPNAFATLQPLHLAVLGDCRSVADKLVQTWRSKDLPAREFAVLEASDGLNPAESVVPDAIAHTIDPQAALQYLDRVLPTDRIVVSDIGRFVSMVPRYLHTPEVGRFIFSIGFGSIGFGLGTALGVALARPEQFTVLVSGDGGFMMNLAELDTAARARVRLLIIVINDEAYGAELRKLRSMDMDEALATFATPSLGIVARALAADGATVRSLAELEALDLSSVNSPYVIDLRVDPGSIPEFR